MNERPLVTVNILSFNRKDELRNTLTKVYEQDYKNIEVIVVDNASIDGSSEMVKNEFPSVQLIQMEKNIGIAGWNEGFKVAKGEYVLVLDDDSYPDNNTIAQGLKAILSSVKIAVVAFNIFNLKLNRSETDSFTINCNYFIGCGALIKTKVLNEIGFFDELIFIYYNEVDLSIRIINNDYIIIYSPQNIVFHDSSINRPYYKNLNFLTSEFRFKNVLIGYQIYLIKYFSLNYVIWYSFKWFVNRVIIAIRFRYFKVFYKGYLIILKSLFSILKNRKVVSTKTQKVFSNGKIPFIDRDYFPGFIKPKMFYFSN